MPPEKGDSPLGDLKTQFERLKQFQEWLAEEKATLKVEVRFMRVCDEERYFTYNRPLTDEEIEVLKAPLEEAIKVPGVSTFAKTEVLHDGDNTILKVGAYHLRKALPTDPPEETVEAPVVASGERNKGLDVNPRWILQVGDTTVPIKDWKLQWDASGNWSISDKPAKGVKHDW